MSNVFSKMFGGGQAPAPATPTAPAAEPAPQQQAAVPAEPQSALDAVGNIWETKGTEKQPQGQQGIDFAALDKAVGGLNFAGNVDPALLQKIEQGGPEATQALMQIQNRVSQETFKQATIVMTKMFEQFKQQQSQEAARTASNVYDRRTIEGELFGSQEQNNVLAHPNVKPIAQAVASKLRANFPNESPQQIAKRTQDMLVAMSQGLVGNQQAQAAPQNSAPATDWDSWFGG